MKIKNLLSEATIKLEKTSASAALDARLLLAEVLGVRKERLILDSEVEVCSVHIKQFQQLLSRRLAKEPVAYILAHQDFWDFSLFVDSSVLIPRPETELLVEWVLADHSKSSKRRVLELGVGSGAITIALARERPQWDFTALDISNNALQVAKKNIANIVPDSAIKLLQSDWFSGLSNVNKFDVIVANPPYISSNSPDLLNLEYEPQQALVAGLDGLECYRHIITTIKEYMYPGATVYLEHGNEQQLSLLNLFAANGITNIATQDDLAGHARIIKFK